MNVEQERQEALGRAVLLTHVLGPYCKWCGDHQDDGQHMEDGSGELVPGGHVFEETALPALPTDHLVDVTFREFDGWVLVTGYDNMTGRVVYLKTRLLGSLAVETQRLKDGAHVALARLACPHVATQAFCAVARIVADGALETDALPPATGFQLDVRVWCTDCGERFVFVGDQLPVGLSPAHPTVDVEGTTLCAPLRPRLYPESWGLDQPAWGVRVR